MDLKIGLVWHSVNSGNLGVGALTVSNLALVRQVASKLGLTPRFTIIGFLGDDFPTYVSGDDIEVLPLNGRAMLPGGAYWKRLGELDCVLDIGAGDSFADIYGLNRFVYQWLTKAMTLAHRTPLILSPQTIGPFTRHPQSEIAASLMNRADRVFARDPLSFEVARTMAPKAKVTQTIDVAFALPFERRTRPAGGPLEVGINVSGLLFNGGHTGANEFGMQISYADYTRQLIQALKARPDVSVKLIAHVYSNIIPHEDDGRIIDQLAAELGVDRAPDFASPSAAKSYISGLDFMVGGRMHACIAAISSGVPVVPVAYSRKFTGLFEGVLGYRHTVPVTGLDTQAAVNFTLERFDRRAELAAEIDRISPQVQALLAGYQTELENSFSRLKTA